MREIFTQKGGGVWRDRVISFENEQMNIGTSDAYYV
jgi:hypothetical protein